MPSQYILKGNPKCKECNHSKFSVKETRTNEHSWIRIRECQKCKKRYKTIESIIEEKDNL